MASSHVSHRPQYFYTIKDLRDALSGGVCDAGATIKEEELKATPIGGRIITSHELTRSRRCKTLSSVWISVFTFFFGHSCRNVE